ncbi:hypothetical protein [Deinococcus hohokamensis]|uniref:Uncharacterized protein n=1 Tax=Deinococcus hohokamensis TaxID=309883 RepID=A0ABV9IC06_9DEIO
MLALRLASGPLLMPDPEVYMTELLHVRWKPGTLDTLLVTSPQGTLEWHILIFERVFGRAAMDTLYLRGAVRLQREALPEISQHSAA